MVQALGLPLIAVEDIGTPLGIHPARIGSPAAYTWVMSKSTRLDGLGPAGSRRDFECDCTEAAKTHRRDDFTLCVTASSDFLACQNVLA